MTVTELKDTLSLTPVTLPEGDREVQGVYIGDLLSWVMGRAQADNVWLTIMSNLNIVAVATLADAGFDPQFGARPIKRAIQRELLNDLSKELIAGSIDRERPVTVESDGSSLVFKNNE